jgi:hypothetical protein
MGEPRPTSIRLDEETLERLKKRAKDLELSMNDLVGQLIRGELADAKNVSVEAELAKILAEQVAELLRSDIKWALQILRRANARSPVEGVLKERMAHYAKDKERFSDLFSAFLCGRISEVMKEHKHVYLLLDAGSTILKLCPTLWRRLGELDAEVRGAGLTIITSNYPAASSWTQFLESAEQESAHHETAIEFELVGGKLQRRYGALTGLRAEEYLTSLSTDNPKRPAGKYFTVLAGNYIRADHSKGPAWPIPLVRGEGQLKVKEAYVQAGDEIYVAGAAPGKIFLASRKEVCDRLKQQDYQDVRIPEGKRTRVKLVSALRSVGILTVHSSLVRKAFGNSIFDIDSQEPSGDITSMGHLLYQYDAPILEKGGTIVDVAQLTVEFPHYFPSGADLRRDSYKPLLGMVRDLFHVDTDRILKQLA